MKKLTGLEVSSLDDSFTKLVAAHLWFGIDPNEKKIPEKTKLKIDEMFKYLDQAFGSQEQECRNKAVLPHVGDKAAMRRAWVLSEFKISRDKLKELAVKLGERPLFLFPQNEKINDDLPEKSEQPSGGFSHGKDFHTVWMGEKEIHLTDKQAQAVQLLYSKGKFQDLHQTYIIGEISPDTSTKRLRDRILIRLAQRIAASY